MAGTNRTGKHDDASWHSEGDFPDDLPEKAGGTHIAMFLAWAVLSGLASEELLEDIGDDVPTLYHVTDSWENYDKLAPVLTLRLGEWREVRG